jgi:hypothetical protein
VEQQRSCSIDVGAAIYLGGLNLLGGKISWATDDDAVGGQRCACRVEQLGNTEVQNPQIVASIAGWNQEAIGRLEITVDDAMAMRMVNSVAELQKEGAGTRPWQSRFPLEERREALTSEQGHDQIAVFAEASGFDHLDDVVMGEPCQQLRLLPKSVQGLDRMPSCGVKEFDRQRPMCLQMDRPVDARCCAGPDTLE